MNTLDSLLANIDANPTDKLLWGVVADHLEEIGDNRSVGMRWLITNGYKPHYFSEFEYPWTWWSSLCANTPEWKDVFPRIETSKGIGDSSEKDFPTLSSAILAAAEAYCSFLKDSENVSPEHTTSG